MERVVSAKEMKWCDDATINRIGIPGLSLMENAGGAIARIIRKMFEDLSGKHFVVFCGKGNNGGDGFVVARHLANGGAAVSVVMMASPRELTGDAKANFAVLKRIAGRSTPPITILRYSRSAMTKLPPVHGVIDAIFGTGFSGKVKPPHQSAVEWINNQAAPVFAVDIPSGLNATTGLVENIAVHANQTITFGLRKIGLLLNEGKESCGRVHVVDIGIPGIVSDSPVLSKTFLVNANDVQSILPRRPMTAHKYSVGKVFVLAGSTGLTGAAALCSFAALRAGAGAVLLGTPEAVYPILSRKLTEVMVMPLPSTADGSLSEKSYEVLLSKLKWADVVTIGPGLSQNAETQSVILKILKEYSGNVLLDADGLTAVAAYGVDSLKRLKATIILTPHAGEFARLVKRDADQVNHDRVESSRSLAIRTGKIVVLKGAPTVTGVPDGSAFINSTGNPGMATVGSGDVLSGIISALWAQSMPAVQAAFSGVYCHGLAGDIAAKKFGARGMVAGDLITVLPHAFSLLTRTDQYATGEKQV